MSMRGNSNADSNAVTLIIGAMDTCYDPESVGKE
jgi:hypothetical protein